MICGSITQFLVSIPLLLDLISFWGKEIVRFKDISCPILEKDNPTIAKKCKSNSDPLFLRIPKKKFWNTNLLS